MGINSYKLGCGDKAFLVLSLCNFHWAKWKKNKFDIVSWRCRTGSRL